MIIMYRQPELFQVVGTLRPSSRLARRLDSRQEKGNKYRDDSDHHQQLDERETASASTLRLAHTDDLRRVKGFNRKVPTSITTILHHVCKGLSLGCSIFLHHYQGASPVGAGPRSSPFFLGVI